MKPNGRTQWNLTMFQGYLTKNISAQQFPKHARIFETKPSLRKGCLETVPPFPKLSGKKLFAAQWHDSMAGPNGT